MCNTEDVCNGQKRGGLGKLNDDDCSNILYQEKENQNGNICNDHKKHQQCQQCWELLHACWQGCANGCNNSQQCWDLQCIVGRIQPISPCNPCVMSVRGPNNVALRFGDHGTKEMLGVVDWKVWPVSNFAQQHPTTCNRVCKRTQHVSSNNVGSCWPTRLRPFERGLTRLDFFYQSCFEGAPERSEHKIVLVNL